MRVVTKDVNEVIDRVIRHLWAIALVAVHTVLLIWSSLRNGFGWMEVGLLPAGFWTGNTTGSMTFV